LILYSKNQKGIDWFKHFVLCPSQSEFKGENGCFERPVGGIFCNAKERG
jgi:hypothetical protein